MDEQQEKHERDAALAAAKRVEMQIVVQQALDSGQGVIIDATGRGHLSVLVAPGTVVYAPGSGS